MRVVVLVLGLAGCAHEMRLGGTVGARVGSTMIDEPAADGASDAGVGLGLRGAVSLRVHPRVDVGVTQELVYSGHDTMDPELRAAYMLATLSPVVRADLDRFVIDAWGGWYAGDRSIDDDDDDWSSYSSVGLRGYATGLAWLWRPRPGGFAIELGPFAQVAWLRSVEDENRTTMFDEEGMSVRSVTVGLVWQIPLGAASGVPTPAPTPATP